MQRADSREEKAGREKYSQREGSRRKGMCKGVLVGEDAGMGPANQMNSTLASNEGDLSDTKSLLCAL